MTVRSRPIRIFKNGQITRYNYFESLALEIMRNANIETLDGEIIHLATKVPYRNKVHYYIISNYRFIYASVSAFIYVGKPFEERDKILQD